ncbi:MAG TPA: ImmA/IrrE family metallo-endopeptidase [Solirubrobacterales bacterium]|nr:ImmA/IrrE family metallo-endopeptidase [Solirubrobacterales bacterium]
MEAIDEGDIHDLERRAMSVLVEAPDFLWDGRSLPVPVEDIIDSHFGLHVREVADMSTAPGCPPLRTGQSLSGLLLAARREIWVNAEEAARWPARRRFTIGHELGHWVLHRDEQASLFCRHGGVDPQEDSAEEERERPPLARIEQEANHFAAALLMPRPIVQEQYERLSRAPDTFWEMCRAFAVSGPAMSRRLRQVIPPRGA